VLLECEVVHARAKWATSSQPSWRGKWQRPGYSLCSVAAGALRCCLKFALFTDGGADAVIHTRPWARLVVEPVEAVSFVMSQKMLRGIKHRVERTALPRN